MNEMIYSLNLGGRDEATVTGMCHYKQRYHLVTLKIP